ncbi:MAG TPA: ribonuclease HI family protein [Spirochaetota bacterium]|nr:ribonuclease HI family protein [Spirochaetota bacterium]
MLLSIDRVLKLLAEGKSLEKIAELAHCEQKDVVEVIEEAITIINRHEKQFARKKIIIKKGPEGHEGEGLVESGDQQSIESQLFEGAELSTIPLNSTLTMYIDGASSGNPGPAGIGIVILDHDGRQVGKISSYIGTRTNNYAEYTALIRALKIAIYFKAKVVKIRTDSELVVKQISGEYKVKNDQIRKLYDQAVTLLKSISNCKIEHVPRSQNDKADYLAKKATQ